MKIKFFFLLDYNNLIIYGDKRIAALFLLIDLIWPNLKPQRCIQLNQFLLFFTFLFTLTLLRLLLVLLNNLENNLLVQYTWHLMYEEFIKICYYSRCHKLYRLLVCLFTLKLAVCLFLFCFIKKVPFEKKVVQLLYDPLKSITPYINGQMRVRFCINGL